MKTDEIYIKDNLDSKDKLTLICIDMIERLHDVCTEEDFEYIKIGISHVWMKYYKLEDL